MFHSLSFRQTIPWVLLIIWMVAIYLFSNQPFSGQLTEHAFGNYNVPVRKLAHMLEFAVLFLLARWSFTTALQKHYNLTALLFVVIYAAFDEWHQAFVPGRSACARDIFVDICGALAAWSLLIVLRKSQSSRST